MYVVLCKQVLHTVTVIFASVTWFYASGDSKILSILRTLRLKTMLLSKLNHLVTEKLCS